jgi:hypothetical protein
MVHAVVSLRYSTDEIPTANENMVASGILLLALVEPLAFSVDP